MPKGVGVRVPLPAQEDNFYRGCPFFFIFVSANIYTLYTEF